jgi:hypothetical protein
MKTGLLLAWACAALAVGGCAPRPVTGPATVADRVKFEYRLTPAPVKGDYHLSLAFADAKIGAAINDANLALSRLGPGYPGGTLLNLKRGASASGSGSGYDLGLTLPQAASYQMTFQVNRTTEPSA